MNDELHQLLRSADAGAPVIEIDPTDLPHRIRRSARRQRRLTACGLAVITLLALAPLLLLRRTSHTQPTVASIDLASLQMQARMYARTAELLQASHHRPRTSIDPTDSFLVELQMQRNRAALALLNDANRRIADQDPIAASVALRRTIELFPETPAAVSATWQLQQIDSSKRQS